MRLKNYANIDGEHHHQDHRRCNVSASSSVCRPVDQALSLINLAASGLELVGAVRASIFGQGIWLWLCLRLPMLPHGPVSWAAGPPRSRGRMRLFIPTCVELRYASSQYTPGDTKNQLKGIGNLPRVIFYPSTPSQPQAVIGPSDHGVVDQGRQQHLDQVMQLWLTTTIMVASDSVVDGCILISAVAHLRRAAVLQLQAIHQRTSSKCSQACDVMYIWRNIFQVQTMFFLML